MSQDVDPKNVVLDKARLKKSLQDINAEIEYLQTRFWETNKPPENKIRSLQQRAANIIRTLGEFDLAELRAIQDDAISTAMALLENE